MLKLLAVTQTCKHVLVGVNLISEERGEEKLRKLKSTELEQPRITAFVTPVALLISKHV